MAKEISFTIDGVAGELKLAYAPFKMKLYQDGKEIQRVGNFNPKYFITNTAGEREEIKVLCGADFVHTVVFRGQKTPLEERLSTLEYVIGGLPVLLVFLGGLIGVALGFVGANFTYDYMRKEKRFPMQLLMSFGVSVFCYMAYFFLALALQVLLGR